MKNLNELQRDNQNLRSLIETSLLLNSPLELSKLLDLIVRVAKKVMRAEAATLMLVDEVEGDLFYEVALGKKGKQIKKRFRLKMGQGIAGWVAKQGKSVIVAEAAKDRRFFAGVDKASGFRTRSIICSPLIVEKKVIGILEAFNPRHKKCFENSDLELFEVFSAQVAVAVAKARWHEKMLHEQKLEQDLNTARDIQMHFLGKDKIEFPKMRFFAKYAPAETIGGDFYDCFPLGRDKVAVILGDVSGKGVPASLYMVKTVTKFRDLVPEFFPDIRVVISLLNQSLVEGATFGMFVTAVIVGIDLQEQKMFVANAGHLPPFLYRQEVGKLESLQSSPQMPLGITEGTVYHVDNVSWGSGDRLLLYSDGLTEARNVARREFGIERLRKLFETAAAQNSENNILPLLFDTIQRYDKNGKQDDQTAVLVAF